MDQHRLGLEEVYGRTREVLNKSWQAVVRLGQRLFQTVVEYLLCSGPPQSGLAITHLVPLLL